MNPFVVVVAVVVTSGGPCVIVLGDGWRAADPAATAGGLIVRLLLHTPAPRNVWLVDPSANARTCRSRHPSHRTVTQGPPGVTLRSALSHVSCDACYYRLNTIVLCTNFIHATSQTVSYYKSSTIIATIITSTI